MNTDKENTKVITMDEFDEMMHELHEKNISRGQDALAEMIFDDDKDDSPIDDEDNIPQGICDE